MWRKWTHTRVLWACLPTRPSIHLLCLHVSTWEALDGFWNILMWTLCYWKLLQIHTFSFHTAGKRNAADAKYVRWVWHYYNYQNVITTASIGSILNMVITHSNDRNHSKVIKVTRITNFSAFRNIHTLECKLKMPRCKECMWKLYALHYGLYFSKLVYKMKISEYVSELFERQGMKNEEEKEECLPSFLCCCMNLVWVF